MPHDAFYWSTEWLALRQIVLRRDGYRCVICRRDVTSRGAARVDHIKRRSDAPHLALDATNCRTLCARCDNQSHREKRSTSKGQRIQRFTTGGTDARGMPLDPRHPWRIALEASKVMRDASELMSDPSELVIKE